MTERSIYAYDPIIPTEREVVKRVSQMVEERRGTASRTRFCETWILTCPCGAVTVSRQEGALERFDADHQNCVKARRAGFAQSN